jgi:hypothetical protein
MNHMLNRVQGRNFLRAHFYTDSGSSTSCLCEYSISGNTITLKLIDKLEYNEDYTNVRCIMSGMTFSYTFSFQGRKLTLTDGTNTVEMYTGLRASSDELNLYADAYMATGAEKLMNADYIYLLHQEGTDYSKLFMKNDTDSVTRYGLANFEENGLDGEGVAMEFAYTAAHNHIAVDMEGEIEKLYVSYDGDNLVLDDKELPLTFAPYVPKAPEVSEEESSEPEEESSEEPETSTEASTPATSAPAESSAATSDDGGDNTLMIVLIAVAAVVIIAAVVVLVIKRKK